MLKNICEEFKDLSYEDLEEDLRRLWRLQSQETINLNKKEGKEPPPIRINSLVQSNGLSIWVPKGFNLAPMPPNLYTFKDTRIDDSLVHVECFIEILIMYLIIDGSYYFMWFSTTFKERTYEWYCNHSLDIFVSWDII